MRTLSSSFGEGEHRESLLLKVSEIPRHCATLEEESGGSEVYLRDHK